MPSPSNAEISLIYDNICSKNFVEYFFEDINKVLEKKALNELKIQEYNHYINACKPLKVNDLERHEVSVLENFLTFIREEFNAGKINIFNMIAHIKNIPHTLFPGKIEFNEEFEKHLANLDEKLAGLCGEEIENLEG